MPFAARLQEYSEQVAEKTSNLKLEGRMQKEEKVMPSYFSLQVADFFSNLYPVRPSAANSSKNQRKSRRADDEAQTVGIPSLPSILAPPKPASRRAKQKTQNNGDRAPEDCAQHPPSGTTKQRHGSLSRSLFARPGCARSVWMCGSVRLRRGTIATSTVHTGSAGMPRAVTRMSAWTGGPMPM